MTPNFEDLDKFFETYARDNRIAYVGYGSEDTVVVAIYDLNTHHLEVYAFNSNFPFLEDAETTWKRTFKEDTDKLDEYYDYVLYTHKAISEYPFGGQ